jgi:hypothetical protein
MLARRRRGITACALVAGAISIACAGMSFPALALNEDERPGYVPTAEEERLPAELRRQMVFFRTTESPGTIVVHTQERFLYLVQGKQSRDPLWHRCRPRRLPVDRTEAHRPQGGMARLDAAARNDPAPALSAALHGRRARQPDGGARALHCRHRLSDPRDESAVHDRQRGLLGLLPPHQPRAHRLVRARSDRDEGRRSTGSGALASSHGA